MIIQDVHLTVDHEAAVLSAKCKIRKIGWDRVYLRVASPNSDYVFDDASPFAAMLLLPAMKQGEDLIIKGSISEQLYNGMQLIMDEVAGWGAGLRTVRIIADQVVKDRHRPSQTASFFSGGVDSFYTYLKHKHDSREADRVDCFILVKNFDIDIQNNALWESALKNVQAVADKEHIELVVVETNIHQLVEPLLAWDYAHGGCLAAVGLFLRRAFRTVYIPSTFSVEEQIPWGSSLALDKHWSTECTSFVHDGSEVTRIGKVFAEVAKSPVAMSHLRVCYMNKRGAYNCGRCPKCLRTMISLYAAGVLGKVATLPHRIDPQHVADIPAARNQGRQILAGEYQNLEALRQRRLNPRLQQAILSSIAQTNARQIQPAFRLKYKVARLAQRLVYFDHLYLRGLLYSAYNGLLGKSSFDYTNSR